MPLQPLPKIFVQIASYRDPECQWTVKDLFEKATHPERISVGICWQYIKDEDDQCFIEPYPFPEQVRVFEVDARESKGACWARNLTQTLWRNEEFTLQIDSHMRFVEGWDEAFIKMYEQRGGGKTVITCYPPNYTPPNDLELECIYGMNAYRFDDNGIFLVSGAPRFSTAEPLPELPIPGAFISANTLFGPSSIITEIQYDPNVYFFGEEIILAARLWTHGYNIYHPNQPVTYHYWDRSKRPTHFGDHHDWSERDLRSFARVKHILGTEYCHDPEILKDIGKYSFGTVRTFAEYQKYSGVSFANKTYAEFTANGIFPTYEEWKEQAPDTQKIFTDIYTTNGWGSTESVSGNGSTLSYTENIRIGIPEMLTQFGITSIFDGPCGDFNWMKFVVGESSLHYTGGDIVLPLITLLQQQYQSEQVKFIHIDLIKDSFPSADLMICRDCLFHLSHEDIMRVLENFVQSDIKYLLTTTMINNDNFSNYDIETGQFKRIDLFSAPYNFPKNVLFRIQDSHHSEPHTQRELCLWSKDQIIAALAAMRAEH